MAPQPVDKSRPNGRGALASEAGRGGVRAHTRPNTRPSPDQGFCGTRPSAPMPVAPGGAPAALYSGRATGPTPQEALR